MPPAMSSRPTHFNILLSVTLNSGSNALIKDHIRRRGWPPRGTTAEIHQQLPLRSTVPFSLSSSVYALVSRQPYSHSSFWPGYRSFFSRLTDNPCYSTAGVCRPEYCSHYLSGNNKTRPSYGRAFAFRRSNHAVLSSTYSHLRGRECE